MDKKRVRDRTLTQAERLILKFGGVAHLVILLKAVENPRHETSIYRWTLPKERGGTDGLIPQNVWPSILKAARLEGIMLGAEDFDPRAFPIYIEKNERIKRHSHEKQIRKMRRNRGVVVPR